MTEAEARAALDEFSRSVYKELRERPHTPLEIRQAHEKIEAKRLELLALVDG